MSAIIRAQGFRSFHISLMSIPVIFLMFAFILINAEPSRAGIDFASKMKALRARMNTPETTTTESSSSEISGSNNQSGNGSASSSDSEKSTVNPPVPPEVKPHITPAEPKNRDKTVKRIKKNRTASSSGPNPFMTKTDTAYTPLATRKGWRSESDTVHKYRIQVPRKWQAGFLMDGNDRVRTFVSPDNNVSVRVRTFATGQGVTTDLMRQAFQQYSLGGGQLLYNETGVLGGVPASLGVYSGAFNNIPVTVVALFTMRSGIGYIVWSMVPQNLFQARSDEIDSVLATFEYLK
ncbi:MAG: hypothetical protein CVV64_13735 [Candidatus Wallbacteria bacterium HGW-Wallbacteria-1]|jgi:hypothetical protein|uniref:Uncharacterized protein n=1 Tax=Candidatus Wallbacteria bacterium HGW-Wallbacteria-1 TaxID=2013854 RepID=A0A2N1PMA8_9BACT|nr:MAG: hypothetical protein CVV64_13735 [Candidatus Wallbacteria bacterium HGW-Wallbacteria-1]